MSALFYESEERAAMAHVIGQAWAHDVQNGSGYDLMPAMTKLAEETGGWIEFDPSEAKSVLLVLDVYDTAPYLLRPVEEDALLRKLRRAAS